MNILLVDDHPMTVDSYVNLLSDIESTIPVFTICNNCTDAYNKIVLAKNTKNKIHLAIVDVSLPPCPINRISNGIDLASTIRTFLPNTKIVILTMHSEPLTIVNIVKKINPEGLISKNDIDYKNFPEVVKNILNGNHYFSKTILESQRELLKINVNWDIHDHKILILLAEGVKNIDLPKQIPLSMSAIEKRKAKIKEHLLLGNGNDKALIDYVKKIGLI